MAEGHSNFCRYYRTGDFNDCDCKPKEKEPIGHWAKEPFMRVDVKGNVIERNGKRVNG